VTFRKPSGCIRSVACASFLAAAFVHPGTGTASALPAFPGAEGFGSQTPGGRGGSVVEVTSLADDGPGSLRAALEDASGPRTVVFRVAGTIMLASPIQLRGEAGSFITIAGQTAPGDGVQLAVYGLQLRDGAHDIVIRYLRIRPGNGSGDYVDDIDAIELWGNDGTTVRNVVIDHCSLQWAMDENFSAWADVADVTVQRSLIAEAQVDGQGHSVAKGALVGADTSDPKPDRFSFHHNVFAHNPDRNPRVAYAQTDFRNNVVYDWGGNSSTMFGPYAGPLGAKPTDVNLIGNVWKRGPASYPDYLDAVWLSPNTRVFPDDNLGTRCPSGCTNEWDLGFREEFGGYDPAGESYRSASAFAVPSVSTYPASSLVVTLIANVGASLPVRDAVDSRILADVVAGTGAAGQGSGYPTLAPAAAPADTDHDGMPDAWETLHGLSPSEADDRNGDTDADGYTNLEEYLAEIGPTEFGCGDGTQHPGEACDDGNLADGDGCDGNCTVTACGNDIVTSGEDCDGGACCSASCDFEPAATPCDDGRLCTSGDACDGGGACVGAEAPAPSCLAAPKGSLQVDAARGRLSWKWQAGAETSVAALGDPRVGGTTYALCLYGFTGGTAALAGEAVLPAGDESWDAKSDGFKYRSRSGAPGGVRSLKIRAGEDGRAALTLKSGGETYVPPSMPLAQDPAVTVQLRNDTGACWSQTYSAPASRVDGERFKDEAD
jgi:cysteine-rich repeat protein